MFIKLLIAHSKRFLKKQSGNQTIVLQIHLSVYVFFFTITINNIAIAPHMILH